MILDYEAVAREMVHKATTDPLTGLLNRRAFLDEVQRHIVGSIEGTRLGRSCLWISMPSRRSTTV
jgi:GGDEF domain-containing protein